MNFDSQPTNTSEEKEEVKDFSKFENANLYPDGIQKAFESGELDTKSLVDIVKKRLDGAEKLLDEESKENFNRPHGDNPGYELSMIMRDFFSKDMISSLKGSGELDGDERFAVALENLERYEESDNETKEDIVEIDEPVAIKETEINREEEIQKIKDDLDKKFE